MLDRTKDIAVSAQAWLDEFERALGKPDPAALGQLFLADSYWRDVLALSWNLQTIAGGDSIKRQLTTLAAKVAPSHFKIAPNRAPPRWVTRAGTNTIEVIFNFETALGRGSGIVRLVPDAADDQHGGIAIGVVARGVAQVEPVRSTEVARIGLAARPRGAELFLKTFELVERSEQRPRFQTIAIGGIGH